MTQGLESLAGNATGARCDEVQIASPTTQAIALCIIAAIAKHRSHHQEQKRSPRILLP